MMKALAMATAISSGGYDINTSWLTLEPNVRKPQTPEQIKNHTKDRFTVKKANLQADYISGIYFHAIKNTFKYLLHVVSQMYLKVNYKDACYSVYVQYLFQCKQKGRLTCWRSQQAPRVWSLSSSCCWTLARSWHGTVTGDQDGEGRRYSLLILKSNHKGT